jgi:hypothetical protein
MCDRTRKSDLLRGACAPLGERARPAMPRERGGRSKLRAQDLNQWQKWLESHSEGWRVGEATTIPSLRRSKPDIGIRRPRLDQLDLGRMMIDFFCMTNIHPDDNSTTITINGLRVDWRKTSKSERSHSILVLSSRSMNWASTEKALTSVRPLVVHGWLWVPEMNRRRYTNGLDTKRVKELLGGWNHARRIGRPLNTFISIHSEENYSPRGYCELAATVRNKLGIYARQHAFLFVAAWARESHSDGTGEHFHVLMHVPPKHLSDLKRKIVGWFPGPEAVDVRPATQRISLTRTGLRMSAVGYLVKQMTPQARYRRGLIRKAGGPIFGKRGGVTQNIGQKAIQRYFEALTAGQGGLEPTPEQETIC